MNALANHGYLPRNGIVTAQQVISATKQVFNMGEDLSGLLCFIAVTYGGNLQTQTFSSERDPPSFFRAPSLLVNSFADDLNICAFAVGGEDDRTYSGSGIGSKSVSRQFGLDAHSRCEGDSSPTRNE